MRVSLFNILFLILHFTLGAQDIDIHPYIKAWQTDDISQTHRSAPFYDSLDLEKDSIKYRRTLAALNDYLEKEFNVELKDYFTIMGPCHAEEVASEKLSYLTFSGADEETAVEIATYFKTEYLNTVVNDDVYGVQFAAILKKYLCTRRWCCPWSRLWR